MNFQVTHLITTQVDQKHLNGIVHNFKVGTGVEWLKTMPNGMVKVKNETSTIQLVKLTDIKVV